MCWFVHSCDVLWRRDLCFHWHPGGSFLAPVDTVESSGAIWYCQSFLCLCGMGNSLLHHCCITWVTWAWIVGWRSQAVGFGWGYEAQPNYGDIIGIKQFPLTPPFYFPHLTCKTTQERCCSWSWAVSHNQSVGSTPGVVAVTPGLERMHLSRMASSLLQACVCHVQAFSYRSW